MSILAPVLLLAASTATDGDRVVIPVVPCASDGQLGPQPAPSTDLPDAPRLAADVAGALALYTTDEGPDVIAPRGWQCLGLSGSNGSTVIVTPTGTDPAQMVAAAGKWPGPAVVASISFAATSGRTAVWEAITRYFPKFAHTVDHQMWADFGFAPLPEGPFPSDRILDRTDREIDLVTPAGGAGAGTDGYLGQSELPTRVFRRLLGSGDEMALLAVDVRLADGQSPLSDAIVAAFRKTP